MNKKFSTLLAAAMLATAFSANASINAKKGEATLLTTGSTYLSVSTGNDYGTLSVATTTPQLQNLVYLNPATWTVSNVKTSLGQTLYSFVNKATNLPFAVDPALAIAVDDDEKALKITNAAPLALGGSASEWVVETVGRKDILVSYIDGENVVYIAQSGSKLYLEKAKKSEISAAAVALSSNQTSIPASISLDAAALNTLLHSVKVSNPNLLKDMFFGLTMNPETSNGQKNYMTSTALHAEDVYVGAAKTGYVTLQAKDQKIDNKDAYVVVDTAYYDGTETSKFLRFTYDEAEAEGRESGSYNFKFTYNAQKDELYAQVKKVVYKIEKAGNITDEEFAKWVKEDNGNSNWVLNDVVGAGIQTFKTDKYIYMARLAGTNVLTVNTDETDGTAGSASASVDATKVQKTVIKLGTNFSGLTQTTLADGVYLIQYKTATPSEQDKNGAYALANLAGEFGWAQQAERQDFNHIPAAQWVVTKNGTASTSSITIQNREFNDIEEYVQVGSDTYYNNVLGLNNKTIQLYAVKDSKDVFFYNGSTGQADTLSFIPVTDAKNLKVGYRYLTDDSVRVQTYVFNYLHGLALDKYLYTPAGKDSIVRVDENGDKTNFRLEIVVKDDHYGVGDSLVRNVYRIKNGESYLAYDNAAKKYMMKEYKDEDVDYVPVFFLKENNCIDGKHYYALVEAHIEKLTDKDGKAFWNVKDNSEVEYYVSGTKYTTNHNSKNYTTGVKVSVDDNTLDLLEGSTDDKFNEGNNRELRTSAFAVYVDDSPLYRHFNNAALGENIDDSTDSLVFVEKTRGEYLMDEWNENLRDEEVCYAGIWNAEKANGHLAFNIDTAWVKRGSGLIKPQYLISVARNDQSSIETIPCTEDGPHVRPDGTITTDPSECVHAIHGREGFIYGKFLVSFADSAIVHEMKAPYMDVENGYARVGFVPAIKVGDSLVILTDEFKKVAPEKLDTATIFAKYRANKQTNFIVDLTGDNHKNVTWSFRYVNPDLAGNVAEEGEANEFLFESNIYQKDGASTLNDQRVDNSDPNSAIVSVGGKATKGFDSAVNGSIAPAHAAWLKMQNGCLVLTRGDSKFDAAKTGSDGALIFNAYQKAADQDMVTDNEEIAVEEGVSVIAGNGVVTIQGAAGKTVVITNILGKAVANTVLTSDNQTINVPAGIVAVAVEGEEAVKAIVR